MMILRQPSTVVRFAFSTTHLVAVLGLLLAHGNPSEAFVVVGSKRTAAVSEPRLSPWQTTTTTTTAITSGCRRRRRRRRGGGGALGVASSTSLRTWEAMSRNDTHQEQQAETADGNHLDRLLHEQLEAHAANDTVGAEYGRRAFVTNDDDHHDDLYQEESETAVTTTAATTTSTTSEPILPPPVMHKAIDLNWALNDLASQAGDYRQPVVTRAQATQDLWEEWKERQLQAAADAVAAASIDTDSASSLSSVWHPDTISFNTVLKAWAAAGHTLAEEKWHGRHNGGSSSNHDYLWDSHVAIFTAHDCAERCGELLRQQEGEQQQQQRMGSSSKKKKKMSSTQSIHRAAALAAAAKVARPDVQSYNTVMDAWAKSRWSSPVSSSSSSAGGGDALQQTEEVFRRLLKSPHCGEPDEISYNSLLEAAMYKQDWSANQRLAKVMQIWKQMHKDLGEDFVPSPTTTNTVLLVFKQATFAAGPEQALALAVRATELFDEFCEKAKTSNGGFHKSQGPDVMTFSVLMDVWAAVCTRAAARKVEELNFRLQSEYNLHPNVYVYTTRITAWSRVPDDGDAAGRVSEILEDMITKKNEVRINHRPFSAALRCWAHSHKADKAVYAVQLLRRMRDLAKTSVPAVRPNLQTYMAALDCCAKTKGKYETAALVIAFAILKTMPLDKVPVTEVAYQKLLVVLESLMPGGQQRDEIALALFAKAKREGYVNAKVVDAFKKVATDAVLLEQLGPELAKGHRKLQSSSRIPSSWRSKIHD